MGHSPREGANRQVVRRRWRDRQIHCPSFLAFQLDFLGEDLVVCEGTSHGEHRDGPWRADVPEHGSSRWCDIFEIRDWKIHRCFIYLDPDYAGKDTARYPCLNKK